MNQMSTEPPEEPCQPVSPGGRSAAISVAALALASGCTVAAAAEKAGVSERTLFRWLRKPAFKRKVSEIRNGFLDKAVGMLAKCMSSAAGVMAALTKSTNEATRLKAARSILELGLKIRDAAEFAERLDALEQQLAKRK
jgi:transposase-like protein